MGPIGQYPQYTGDIEGHQYRSMALIYENESLTSIYVGYALLMDKIQRDSPETWKLSNGPSISSC